MLAEEKGFTQIADLLRKAASEVWSNYFNIILF